MAAARGALVLWLDYRGADREAFYAWHARDHIPGRREVPGFLRARRYVALRGKPEYLIWYELDQPAALEHPRYAALSSAAPSPGDQAVGLHFDGVTRWLCQAQSSAGQALGGLLLSVRYAVPSAAAEAHAAALRDDVLPRVARSPGVCGCHSLRLLAPAASATTELALLVESWGDEAQVREIHDELTGRLLPLELRDSTSLPYRLQLLY
jgi:hypothetical protein